MFDFNFKYPVHIARRVTFLPPQKETNFRKASPKIAHKFSFKTQFRQTIYKEIVAETPKCFHIGDKVRSVKATLAGSSCVKFGKAAKIYYVKYDPITGHAREKAENELNLVDQS